MILSQPSQLSQHRLRRSWSQAHLAQESGVSRAEISAIETGRLVPSVAVALRLAAAMGESVEAIFGGTPVSAPLPWAWPPDTRDDHRVWRATVGGKLLAFPVEPTAAGMIPHDGTIAGHRFEIVAPQARPERTLVIAGCDPLVGLLVQELSEHHGVRVLPLQRSSSEALDLLRRGLVQVAGVHWTDDRGHAANDEVVRAHLGTGYSLLHQLRWDAGIAVMPDRRERTASALLKANVRWVNREEGSAARHAFDRLLADGRRPKGYGHVVHDHRSVAATVSSGWAEAGFCVRPAAAEVRLGFIPLQREAYELCVSESMLDDPRVMALGATLRSRRYRQLVSDIPGCASNDTGEQRGIA